MQVDNIKQWQIYLLAQRYKSNIKQYQVYSNPMPSNSNTFLKINVTAKGNQAKFYEICNFFVE